MFISWNVVLSRHLRRRNRPKHRLHCPANGLRPCHREVHLPEIDLGRHKLKGHISLAIAHGLRRHHLALGLLPAVHINQHQLLPNPHLWLQRHHPAVPAHGKGPCLSLKFPAALRLPVNNEVHTQCDSGCPTAFDTPEMLCSHSGSYLSSGMIWPRLSKPSWSQSDSISQCVAVPLPGRSTRGSTRSIPSNSTLG